MKITECFTCDLSKCDDCKYRLNDGYALTKKRGYIKRSIEAWNYYHPDDPMPQKGFVIHHINKNKLDDSKENVEKLTDFEHSRYHMTGNQNGKANKGKKCSEEHKEKISIGNKGKKQSEEAKKKIGKASSIAMKGKQNALGCKHSEKQNARQSEALTGRKLTKEHKDNIRAARTGKKHSKETREKLRRSFRHGK
ncbi:MAG: hypothetical protein KAV18_08035 [Candidatus Omnitrophica bacterium]|nr:hypothetical protein [Candidatus Omnitrophota bacterium]